MRFLYKRGRGARRRVVHLCEYDPRTGQPTMLPLCGDKRLRLDTTCNFPLGLRRCRRCAKAAIR
jgi:hypothetical protein